MSDSLITVLLVDDEPLVTIGLRASIEWNRLGCSVVGSARSGMEALEIADELKPDVIITDIRMPGMSGIELMEAATERGLQSRFIVLSVLEDFTAVQQALRLGACDYLIKSQVSSEAIENAIRGCFKHGVRPVREDNPTSITHRILELLTSEGTIDEAFVTDIDNRLGSYRVVLVSMDNTFRVRRNLSPESFGTVRIAFHDFVRRAFGKGSTFSIELTEDMMLSIVSTVRTEDVLYKDLKTLQARTSEILNVVVSVGISGIHETVRTLSRAYSEAKEALQTRFFAGGSLISSWRNFDPRSSQNSLASLHKQTDPLGELRRSLQEAIALWDTDILRNRLDALSTNLKQVLNTNEEMVRAEYAFILERMVVRVIEGTSGTDLDHGNVIQSIALATDIDSIHREIRSFVDQLEKYVKTHENAIHPSRVERMTTTVLQRYTEPLTLADIAREMYVSEGYLRRLFKEYTGCTFVEYLTKVRVERAKVLLGHQDLRINEIATAVGYNDPSYFIRLFRRKTGISPERFRLRLKEPKEK